MSYDISNYVFKGVPLDELIDPLKNNNEFTASNIESSRIKTVGTCA